MAIAAFLRTTATTSTTSPRGDLRGGLLPALARRLPNRAELGDLQSQLAAARPLPEPILRLMKQLPAIDGMDTLRTLTSALGHYDPEVETTRRRRKYRKAVRLTAQIGSIVATYGRMQAGGGLIEPIRRWGTRRTSSTC